MINLTNTNILVVDDEPPIRKLLARKLEAVGACCVSANSVNNAIKLLTEKSFDLLITDYQMPLNTGGVLLDYAKQHHPQVTRVAITGHSTKTIVKEILDIGVYGYLLKPISGDALLITIENALRLHHYEKRINDQQTIITSNLANRKNQSEAIMNNLHLGVVLVTPEMRIIEVNRKMRNWFPAAQNGVSCFESIRIPASDTVCSGCRVTECFKTGQTFEVKKDLVTVDGMKDFMVTISPILSNSNTIDACLIIYEDITTKLQIEQELQQAKKLESVGQLAAGIAHEINSPIQYIGDNVNFIKDSIGDLNQLIEYFRNSVDQLDDRKLLPDDIKKSVEAAVEDADIEYLAEELPTTLSQTIDGIKRVEKIVRAMKEFSHPGEKEKVLSNINNIIKSTTTVCRNEWKYVADLELNLDGNLPLIPCYSSEISQVILNMVVNAAHGITEKEGRSSTALGSIVISSSQNDSFVFIKIADNGVGMSDEIQNKMFEPFYTTKEIGKGTGQGLAISKRVIVDEHNGKLECSSKVGVGTEFTIQLPIA